MLPKKTYYRINLWLLPLLAISFLLAAVVLISILQSREKEIKIAERDDGLWAAYQLDRENLKFYALLSRYQYQKSQKIWQEAELRFEILYSRLVALRHGQYYNLIEIKKRTRDLSAKVEHLIESMDNLLLLNQAESSTKVVHLMQLSQQLQLFTEELITTLKDVSSQINTQKRQELSKLYNYLFLLIFFLTLTTSLIIYLLIRKMLEAKDAQRQAQFMAKELETAVSKSEAASRAKSDFLATMSHEIRTPMNGVLGMSELLFETPLNNEQKKYTQAINNSATALMKLLTELMDISKLESGHLILDYNNVELAPLLKEVIDFFAAGLNQKPITLSLNISADVGTFYKTDAGRLRQILLNLVGNAIKFTEQGTVEVRVSLIPDGLFFEVEDTGVGIDAAVQQKMFELFTQADASISRRYGGTGLGLSISKRIIEQMQGSIGIHSTLNKGSCVYFTLPIHAS